VRTGTTASGWLPRYRLHFVSLLNVAPSPLLWCARWGVISAGETGLALACLNPAVVRKLWWILQIWCDFPTARHACGALPIARANSRQIHELQVADSAARASFPVRKKLRPGCNDLHALFTNLSDHRVPPVVEIL